MLKLLIAAAVLGLTTTSALSGEATGLVIMDPYARASSPNAKAGAAFMQIMNHGAADRLIAVSSDVAQRVELHTHLIEGDVMRMVHVEEGFEIGAGETLSLERGGKHVMLMGLTRQLAHGDVVKVLLTFETAGYLVVEMPVDLERAAGHRREHGHGHGHGTDDSG
ncbi:MAG: copper chaperone PCu(A)C [Pseudomonadota bacterium]